MFLGETFLSRPPLQNSKDFKLIKKFDCISLYTIIKKRYYNSSSTDRRNIGEIKIIYFIFYLKIYSIKHFYISRKTTVVGTRFRGFRKMEWKNLMNIVDNLMREQNIHTWCNSLYIRNTYFKEIRLIHLRGDLVGF